MRAVLRKFIRVQYPLYSMCLGVVLYSYYMIKLYDTTRPTRPLREAHLDFEVHSLDQLRDYTDLEKLPDGIGVVSSEKNGIDPINLILLDAMVIQNPDTDNEKFPWYLMSRLTPAKQSEVLKKVRDQYPHLYWLRGGNLFTVYDWRNSVTQLKNYIKPDNTTVMLDAPYGMLGNPSRIASFLHSGDSGIRKWQGIYMVSLDNIIQGLDQGIIRLGTGNGYDPSIDCVLTTTDHLEQEVKGFTQWLRESVSFYDVKGGNDPQTGEFVTTERKAQIAQEILLSKCYKQELSPNSV